MAAVAAAKRLGCSHFASDDEAAADSSPSLGCLNAAKYSRAKSKTCSGRCKSTEDMKSFITCRSSGCCSKYVVCSCLNSSSRSSNFSCCSGSFIMMTTGD
eukprot:TRINITY_DN58183_c0_g1_i1.p1 TRINITY_DN58183_c0_g1~~TRINITY_DN58183_c0_g1_i1.p1  ORF type:complete len:100 (+),score=17.60 TRINITY_DN58183_c0_g1_i1:194-493(+)